MALTLALSASTAHAAPTAKAPIVKQELPPTGPYPDAECDKDNSPGIYIGPDNVLWECICEERQFVSPDPDDCHWYEQGRGRAANLKKLVQAKYRVRTIARNRVWVIS